MTQKSPSQMDSDGVSLPNPTFNPYKKDNGLGEKLGGLGDITRFLK
tara:strand:+ start:782 stop:919 length:138 start_codon:yes stop_codon:yes gene_type:complete